MNTFLNICEKVGLVSMCAAMCVVLIAGFIAAPWLLGAVVGMGMLVIVCEVIIVRSQGQGGTK
jgi:hypothetical protein